MTLIFAIFILCFLGVTADNIPISFVDKIMAELTQIYKGAADTLKHKIDESFFNLDKQIKAAVGEIENLRKTSEACVNAENKKFSSTLEIFNKSVKTCRDEASKISNKILADITNITQQLETDGTAVKWFFQECIKVANAVNMVFNNNMCYVILADKDTLYRENASKSIKELNYSIYYRIYYFGVDVDSCYHNPFEDCIYDLARIYQIINNCIANSKIK